VRPKTFARRNIRRPAVLVTSVCLAAVAAAGLAACGSSSTSSSTTSASASGAPKHGGSLTVLEGASFAGAWPGLDPATDTDGAANQSYMNAIYGELFELGTGGKLTPNLATGYSYANGGKTVNITLRQGVTFSDGTPFNAAAVVFNWKRDVNATCTCKPIFLSPPVITQTGPYTLSFTLPYVYAPFINSLQANIFNWIASPTALQKMGEKAFALAPVGAGPFTVVSDTPGSQLVLKKNPHYWEQGKPYLDNLTFKTVAADEPAYEAMLAGSGQAYEGMSTPQLVKTFESHFQVTAEPSTSPYDIQLNTKIAPFNNIKARQAIYYATNAAQLDQALFQNTYPVTQSFTAEAGLFYHPVVPGYIGYDLAKAKSLVQAVGGINITLDTITSPVAQALDEALQTQWQAAGMKVTLHNYDLTGLIATFQSHKWQAFLQTAGAWDPGTGVGVAFRFASYSPFTGVFDKKVDNMINAAAATIDNSQRSADYAALSAYIAQQAYGPFLFPIAGYSIAAHGVGGPGLTTAIPSIVVLPGILWQDVYNNNG
jgi:peptide/nickel transport system substrate-binding protein